MRVPERKPVDSYAVCFRVTFGYSGIIIVLEMFIPKGAFKNMFRVLEMFVMQNYSFVFLVVQ